MAKENKSVLQVATENSARQGTFSIQFICRHCHPSGQQIFAGLSSFGFDCGNFFFPNLCLEKQSVQWLILKDYCV